MARDNQNLSTIIEADCNDSYFPFEDELYEIRHYMEQAYDKLIKLEKNYKPICEENDSDRAEKFLKRNELKCLKDSVETPIGLKVLTYC